MARASKRGLVLDTAEALFVQNGFTATGINQITADAGIASMTLYNNFKSKDDLVLAVLQRASDRMFEELEAELEEAGDDPGDRILAVFDYLQGYATDSIHNHEDDGSFTGSIFDHAASEFRPLSNHVHQAVVEHKKRLLKIFQTLVEAMEHPAPEALAETLLLLVNGAFASAQITGDMSFFERARNTVLLMLEITD